MPTATTRGGAVAHVRSLQTEPLASGEQFDRLAKAPFAGLRSLGRVNPHDEITPVRRRKRLKVSPGLEVRLDSSPNVGRQLRNPWTWRIPVSSRSCSQAGRGEEAGRLELVPASPVDVRPLARWLARRDFDRIAIVVQAFDQAVDPPEAERLVHEVFIRHGFDAGVLLVADKPDAGTGRVVPGEPSPPLFPCSHVERDQTLRHRFIPIISRSRLGIQRNPDATPRCQSIAARTAWTRGRFWQNYRVIGSDLATVVGPEYFAARSPI